MIKFDAHIAKTLNKIRANKHLVWMENLQQWIETLKNITSKRNLPDSRFQVPRFAMEGSPIEVEHVRRVEIATLLAPIVFTRIGSTARRIAH